MKSAMAAELSAAIFIQRCYMRTLSIDIETYSSAEIGKCGVYRYSEAPDFEVLLLGYNQPAYDTATTQYTIQWTWCLRTEVTADAT